MSAPRSRRRRGRSRPEAAPRSLLLLSLVDRLRACSARCSSTSSATGSAVPRPDAAHRAAVVAIRTQAGARPAILGTLYLMVLLLLFAVPIGVGTAIYLEEYADRTRWYNRLLEINIQNLAAVPSIVYGILGLAFLVRGLGLGRVLLAGALILTLLVLPTVIVAAREAIRAVPDSIRQGALRARRDPVAGRLAPGAAGGDARASRRARSSRSRARSARRRRCSWSARSRTSPSTRRSSGRSRRCRSRSTSGSRGRRRSSSCSPRPAIIVLLVILLTHERVRDLAPQPLPEEDGDDDMESTTTNLQNRGVDRAASPSASDRRRRAARSSSTSRDLDGRLRRRAGARGRLARDLQELRHGVHRARRAAARARSSAASTA